MEERKELNHIELEGEREQMEERKELKVVCVCVNIYRMILSGTVATVVVCIYINFVWSLQLVPLGVTPFHFHHKMQSGCKKK